MTDILAGNTDRSVNPFWGKWRITDGVTGGKVRPAAYKTGTTSDNKDVHAYGYLAPPMDKKLPALVAGIWMGNSDNTPNDGKLSLDTSAPLWSAILSDVSKGMPIEGFSRTKPKGLVTGTVDAFTGLQAERLHPAARSRSCSSPGTAPTKAASYARRSTSTRRAASAGRTAASARWSPGRSSTTAEAEAGLQGWQKADAAWQARAARGAGVAGGPKRTRTAYFYGGGFYPFGRSWGSGGFAPDQEVPARPADAHPVRLDLTAARPARLDADGNGHGNGNGTATAAGIPARAVAPTPTWRIRAAVRGGRSSPRRRPRRARPGGSSSPAGARPPGSAPRRATRPCRARG